MSDNMVSVRVWGDFACFTRPEMKVERVSYPLMTPSAARGALEAIFWEPQMHYLIDGIRVIKRGRWVSFRRNEVTSVVSLDNVATWMRAPERFTPIQAGGGAPDGTQRNMLALEDVEYVITAEVALTGLGRRSGESVTKYVDEVARRARRGKCFHRPALGLREFAADFAWEADPQEALERRASEVREDHDWRRIWPEEDLGLMLYDVFDPSQRAQGFRWLNQEELVRARADRDQQMAGSAGTEGAPGMARSLRRSDGVAVDPRPAFFHATVRDARMDCHPQRVRIVA